MVKQLFDRVICAQQNVQKFVAHVQEWSLEPLIERIDGKEYEILSIDDRMERIIRRYGLVAASGEEAVQMLNLNRQLYFNLSPTKTQRDQEVMLEIYLNK